MAPAPLPIALVITELEVGGAERCLTNLAIGLNKNAFSPVVYSLASRPVAPQDRLVQALEASNIPVRFLGLENRWRLVSAVRALRRHLKCQSPRVVQSMLYHANVVTSLAVRADAAVKLSTGIRVADPSVFRQITERLSSRRADRVVCVSQTVSDYAARRLALSSTKRVVIANGVDVVSCQNRAAVDLGSLGLPPGRRALACVTRLTRQKGVDRLVDVAPQLFDALPDHDLVLVGEGPLAPTLRRDVDRLGVGSRVHFVGWRPDVIEILLACDLMILPSRWEGMPNVLLEAMACGRPVVCTQAEGVQQVLGPLYNSQSIPVFDSQSLVNQVLRILRDPALAGRLGRQNRERVAHEFSLDAMVRRYERLFGALESESGAE